MKNYIHCFMIAIVATLLFYSCDFKNLEKKESKQYTIIYNQNLNDIMNGHPNLKIDITIWTREYTKNNELINTQRSEYSEDKMTFIANKKTEKLSVCIEYKFSEDGIEFSKPLMLWVQQIFYLDKDNDFVITDETVMGKKCPININY